LKIAFYLDKFPVLSQTFILNQITGMMDREQDVTLFARKFVRHEKLPPEIAEYGLLEKVRYVPEVPRNYALRLLKAEGLALITEWHRQLSLLRALNMKKYGRYAISLRLFYAAVPPLAQPRYDVIHAQFGPLGLKALALRQIGALRGKLFTSFRGFDATSRLEFQPDLFSELFREGDLFLPVSRSLKQRLIDHGCDEKKIAVHHSGIDCARFNFTPRQRDEGGRTNLISVSRLVDKKGISYAVRAVSRLIASGRKISYSIVGDGKERPALERLVAELGIGGQVKLLGWRTHDELTFLLREAHLLVAPSVTASNGDQEGIPNSVKEAMAMGLPVLSTFHGGIPELVEDGESGFLVPERDVEALSDRLAHLHDHPEIWTKMGEAGRAKIEKEFDINRLNDELVDLYANACSQDSDAREAEAGRSIFPLNSNSKDCECLPLNRYPKG
jgi:colanic acid/amylovoran biosynthesis glycosyltransferase